MYPNLFTMLCIHPFVYIHFVCNTVKKVTKAQQSPFLLRSVSSTQLYHVHFIYFTFSFLPVQDQLSHFNSFPSIFPSIALSYYLGFHTHLK